MVYPFSDNFLHQLPHTFEKADGAVGFGEAVVWFVQLIQYYHRGMFPWVGSFQERPVEYFG